MRLDIQRRTIILQYLVSKQFPIRGKGFNLCGYDVKFPVRSRARGKYRNVIKPPFSYHRKKRYNFKYCSYFFDLYRAKKYYSLFNVHSLYLNGNYIDAYKIRLIEEFCCTVYFTYAYLWIRSIIESMVIMGNRVKVKETGLEYNSVIFSPLFSDLESRNPDVIINLCWFPRECEIKGNVLNLSIFNN